jgi:hypothetical protein
MKKIVLMLASVSLLVFKTSGQEKTQADEYKVPASFQFNYKVVYQVNNENKNTPKTITYYFTKSGDFMGMQPSPEENKDMELMVNTKDGKMITFSEGHSKNQKVMTVMDMRHMMKGMGSGLTELAKTLPKKEKPVTGKKENALDNFKKTGKTKQVFGYTAEEYTKNMSKEDKDGKVHTGTMTVWYANVDFDPQMMFSMGMGNISSPQAKMHQSHQNNMIGMGLTEKNYLLIEVDAAENGGKSGTGMKVISIDKTTYNKETVGYTVRKFGNLTSK